MKKVAIVVGHGPSKDRGAQNQNGTTELDWNTDLAHRIIQHMQGNSGVEPVLIMRRIEGLSPYKEVNEAGVDFAVEFHCNAFDRTASGTEMIHHHNSEKGKKLAKTLLTFVVATLQLPDRGIKPPWNGRGGAFLAETNCPAVIAESFFIDNHKDLLRANEVKDVLAKAYAQALITYSR